MYKRLLTMLTVAVALAGLIVVPVAAAGQSQHASKLGEIGAWAVPSTSIVVSKPLPAPAQQALVRGKLGEIGLWAVPSRSTRPSQQTIRGKLGEIGAWAVPSTSTTPVVSDNDGLDWNNAEVGAGLVLVALLVGVASFVTIRRHQRPIAH
jgi:hypothetical protein